jgi:hypothetical protein
MLTRETIPDHAIAGGSEGDEAIQNLWQQTGLLRFDRNDERSSLL